MNNRFLRASLSVILVLCMLISTPVAALAAESQLGEDTHTHSYTSVVTAPTCTEKGYTTYTCSCGDTYKADEVAALGHSWDAGKVTKEPTEKETGIRTYTCTACGATKTEEIPALEHTHIHGKIVTPPTCTEKGYTTYTCSCGDTYIADEVAALGHNEVTDKGYAATCTEAGLTDGKHCDRCNTVLTKQEAIPALGHNYVDGACSACGEAEAITEVAAPQILSCYSKLQTSVKVTWSLVEGADGYQIYRSATPDDEKSWACVKTVTNGETDRYTNQGLTEGTTYYYKVRAYVEDASGNRTYSDFSNVDYMPAAVVWDAPYSNATFRIRLRWNEIGGAHGYQIWRLNEDGEWKIVKTLGDKGNTLTNNQGATTAYSNTGLTSGDNYTYKMRAFMITEDGKKVFGAYSDEFTVAVMPEKPVLTASSPKPGRALLEWNAINGAAGYQVWMLENGSWNIVKSLTDGSTTYTKYDLEGGVEYQFKVRAYTEVDGKKTFGAYSEIVASTPAVEYKGKCGDNLTWKVADRVLTISGTGAMYDYSEAARPWDGLDFGLVSIKSGVTTIGADAFSGLIAHQYNLPDTLTKIGSRAFAGCQITQIAIPASVTQIDEMAFAQTNLTSVTLPKGLTILSYGVFEHTDITEIEIPAGVTTIDANAFYACAKLADVSLPNSLVTIGTNAFAQCDALEIAILPDSVTTMGIGVFEYSNKLASVYLPAGITDIPARTFYGCSSLVEVVLPAGVTFISDNAFHGCNSLTNILYLGTEEQISQLEIADGNDPLLNADLYLVTMITEQPADQTVKAGEKVTFHAAASREGCTYQWYCLAPNSDEWVACTQSGNKTDTLSFTATKDLNGYYFLCEITDPYGNSGDTEAALLTVK